MSPFIDDHRAALDDGYPLSDRIALAHNIALAHIAAAQSTLPVPEAGRRSRTP